MLAFAKYNFCTLFDSYYLAKGLALYYSLEKNCPAFHLYIFAFDNKSHNYLLSLKLENATIISLNQFEDEELLKVKPNRSIAEYCWTSTSSVILYILQNYNLESCTYLDADLFFYTSPEVLFKEIGSASIAFTRHNYSPIYDQTKTNGEYCVQFMFFRNDKNGIEALKWWRNSCLNWCYNYLEDGKFGDQGYIPELRKKFNNIHIIQNEGAGMAPWNIQKFKYVKNNTFTNKKTNSEIELIFYHFHNLKFEISGKNIFANVGAAIIPKKILTKIYDPYLIELHYMWLFLNAISENNNKPTIYYKRISWLQKFYVILKVQLKKLHLIRIMFIEKGKYKWRF